MRAAWALAGVVLLMGGCATVPKTNGGAAQAEQRWEQRADELETISDFSLQARVASGGLLGVTGDLRWEQHGEQFELHFSGPFGIGALQISGHDSDVQIRTKKNTYQTDDPQRFLREKVGWDLPVRGLRYWVIGLPSPHSDADLILDDQGRPEEIEQEGWTLHYSEFQTVGNVELPRRFELSGAHGKFKIVVDRWSDIGFGG